MPDATKQNITPHTHTKKKKIQKQSKLSVLKILMNVCYINTLFKEWAKEVLGKHLMYG